MPCLGSAGRWLAGAIALIQSVSFAQSFELVWWWLLWAGHAGGGALLIPVLSVRAIRLFQDLFISVVRMSFVKTAAIV